MLERETLKVRMQRGEMWSLATHVCLCVCVCAHTRMCVCVCPVTLDTEQETGQTAQLLKDHKNHVTYLKSFL